MDVTLLRADPADAGELLTLQRAAYLSEARLHNDFDLPPLTETVAEIAAACAAGTVLKAVRGTRIVGAVRATVHDRTCRIGRLAVVPDLRGEGLGRILIEAAEARHAAEIDRFELFTGPKSAHNVAVYEHLGYHRIPSPTPLIYLEKPAPAF